MAAAWCLALSAVCRVFLLEMSGNSRLWLVRQRGSLARGDRCHGRLGRPQERYQSVAGSPCGGLWGRRGGRPFRGDFVGRGPAVRSSAGQLSRVEPQRPSLLRSGGSDTGRGKARLSSLAGAGASRESQATGEPSAPHFSRAQDSHRLSDSFIVLGVLFPCFHAFRSYFLVTVEEGEGPVPPHRVPLGTSHTFPDAKSEVLQGHRTPGYPEGCWRVHGTGSEQTPSVCIETRSQSWVQWTL